MKDHMRDDPSNPSCSKRLDEAPRYVSEAMLEQLTPAELPSDYTCMSELSEQNQ